MYEKPELTLVGSAAEIVLGPPGDIDDNEGLAEQFPIGLVQGLDD
jgi:hypothetical protein